ncbi:MAG: histidine kinase [Chitinophagaceae bacterium]|nr:histidine kinase [Chitinophagaceae bacterium]
MSGNILAQQITDSVHPYFSGKLHAREMNERYDYFELSIPTKKTAKTKLYNDVELSVFHSNNLYVNTVFNKQSDIRDNKELFDFTIPEIYAQITGSYKNTSAVPLFDSLPVIVTAYGIDSFNRDLYRFRVLKNKNEEIIPWSRIQFFTPAFMHFRYNADGTEQTQMAYLGQFHAAPGNSITVEVKNLRLPDTTYSISAVWKKRAPGIIATFTPHDLRAFIAVYKYRWKNDRYGPEGPSYYGDISLPPVDSLLTVKQKFDYNENNLFLYLNDKVKSADLVEYNLISGKDSTGWVPNHFDANVIWLQQLSPGKYTLYLRYAFQRQTINSFSFTITPAWHQTAWFKVIAGVLSVLAVMSVYLFIKNKRQQAKLQAQQTQHQLVQAEIKSIRSQFNPHFVFNALNSIQGLITKNDIESAHVYLHDFSRLLRNSLKESEKDFISLAKDIHLTDNYLKLEQLRFGFCYEINMDKKINKDAIEVPVLLLQPVIENAIKHGLSGQYENGLLKINYTAAGNDITVTITDNGSGYSNSMVKKGHGLKLTNDRIALMNKLLKEQSIHWQTNNTGNGTQVMFVFKNWLL